MNIILSLDYELFLNDITGTVQNCLIKPISELQKVCDKYGIHYTVFVDAAYLYILNKKRKQFKELDADYKAICENIRWMQLKGHDIELHIHPQWFFSDYKDGEWRLDWDHYSLADVGGERAVMYFKESKELLDSIIGEKATVFRAGGYTLQGFDYVKAFRECGIIADSSVLPNQKEVTTTHRFDYSRVERTPYHFSEDVCISMIEGGFTEIPISIAKRVFLPNYLLTKRHYMSLEQNVNWGDGGDFTPSIQGRINRIVNSFSIFKQPKATIDYQSYYFLRRVYKEYKKEGYFTIIGHPKNFSPASLHYFDDFVKDCHKIEEKFLTIRECCALLN